MLIDNLYVQQSLINNLFYLRTIREFCLNIQLSFYQNDSSYAEIAEGFGKRYEELGSRLIPLANERLPKEIIESNSFVTDYTLNAELLTEKLFKIDINTDLTVEEMNLVANDDGNLSIDSMLIEQVSELNNDAIQLTKNFIEFCQNILDEIKKSNLFSYSYPLIFSYMIEEASLYVNDMERIQSRTNADPTFVVNYQYWFSDMMMKANQFIIGLSDPNQISVITNANNYRKLFSEQMKKYSELDINPESQSVLNEQTIDYMNSFISFLSKIIDGILNEQLFFIVEPVFFDNILTEAYYFLYLLKGSGYGIKK